MNKITEYETQQREKWGDIWDKPAYLRRQYAKGLITTEEMERIAGEGQSKSRCCEAEILEEGQCESCGEGCEDEHIREYQDEAVKEMNAD